MQTMSIKYDPYKSIKENAHDNNVSESCVWKYIKTHNIDRAFEASNVKIEHIKNVLSVQPNAPIYNATM